MRTPLRLALALLAVLAGAGAAPAQDEIDKARAEAFDQRLFARPLAAHMTFACFTRVYDAGHLAGHPQQKVAAMKLLVTAEHPPDDKAATNYAFRLGFKYRHRAARFDTAGSCNHFTPEDAGDEIRLGCGVDCDGGGLNVAVSEDAKSATVRLRRIRVWQNSKPDDEADQLEAGADDGIFRLERADNRECAALVTDRKELAALRRK